MSGPPPPAAGHHAVGPAALSSSVPNSAQHLNDSVLMMQGLKLNGSMGLATNSVPPTNNNNNNNNNNSTAADGGGGNGVVVNNGEPKFYHYCYVCNTQLNSCKQALLHCSGKRHRKKLQFLQSRKHAVGSTSLAAGSPIGAAPPPGPPASSDPSSAGLNFPPHHLVAHGHGAPHRQQQQQQHHHHIGAMQQQAQQAFHTGHHHPPQHHFEMHAHSLGAAPHHPYFHPPHHYHQQPTMLSPAAVAGTDQWLHAAPAPFILQQPMAHHPLALYGGGQAAMLPPHMQHLTFAPMPYPPALMDSYANSSSSSSPINLAAVHNDGTASSGYSGSRSAVISPSETSSMSSDPSSESRSAAAAGYKCHTCGRRFATGALLHNHLQTAKHYKHHAHHFHYSTTSATSVGAQGSLDGRIKGDGSETDSTSTSSIYYCSLCSIAVNSHAQMQSHHAGIKHRQRANGQTQKRNSRSSSTSSEPPGEIVVESGYTSGSGDEVLLRVGGLEADGTGPSYKCQLCSVHMNSEAQAKQHLNSPKHMLRASGSLRPFRRKTSNSFRKKASKPATVGGSCDKSTAELEDDGCETSPMGGLDDGDLRSDTPSPELGETDSTLTVRPSE